jgi:cell division septation protein DedD
MLKVNGATTSETRIEPMVYAFAGNVVGLLVGPSKRGGIVGPIIYVVVGVVVLAVLVGAVTMRRKSNKRAVSYAPDPNIKPGEGYQGFGVRPGPGTVPEVAIPTPEEASQEIAHNDFASDVADDLLDPANPRHAQWVKEHPEMGSDAEWVAEHPEDNPS